MQEKISEKEAERKEAERIAKDREIVSRTSFLTGMPSKILHLRKKSTDSQLQSTCFFLFNEAFEAD